jgi:hypothetical protein
MVKNLDEAVYLVSQLTTSQFKKYTRDGTLTQRTYEIFLGSVSPFLALRRAILFDNILRGAKRMRDLYLAERIAHEKTKSDLSYYKIQLANQQLLKNRCPHCKGDGWRDGWPCRLPCWYCKGTGKLMSEEERNE